MNNQLTFLSILLFLSISFSVQAQQRQCGHETVTELLKNQYPEYVDEIEDFHQRVIPTLERERLNPRRAAATILRIPVVVHVIHNGEPIGTGANLSVAQIQAQLDVLNEDFSAQNPNFSQTPSQWAGVTGSADIQFCLASLDPNGNPTTGITRHNMTVTGTGISDSNIESSIKPATRWDANLYYNIWTLSIPGTTAQGGTVGYAYIPYPFTIGSNSDGSVVDWNWFGGPGFGQSGYKTLTHETGHYLGLPHTFDETSCDHDDNIGDTPNIGNATSTLMPSLFCSNNNFPTGPSSCGNEHMYTNYMDYVNSDYCYTSFTQGQIAVMRGLLEGSNVPGFSYGSRANLVSNSAVACNVAQNDIGITSIINPADGNSCDNSAVMPEVVVGNFGANDVNNFTITYQVNNGTPIVANFNQNIQSGSSITVLLNNFTPPSGTYTFTASTSNPNGTADDDTSNDQSSVQSTLVATQSLPLTEAFNDNTFNPTPAGIFSYNPDSDNFTWAYTDVSANGSSGGSAYFDNYDGTNSSNPLGTIDALITPVFDLSNHSTVTLSFDVAYARYFGNNQYFTDSLQVMVSTDCGQNFNQTVFNQGGEVLETGTARGNPFTPTANEWQNKSIDLSVFAGQPNVAIAFVNKSGWGNNIYLDNININTENECTLEYTISKTDETSFGANDGTATVSVTNGDAPFSYQWSNGATTASIQNLSPNTYNVTVSDANCEGEGSATIQAAALNCEMTVSLTATDLRCFDGNDGSVQSQVIGGQPPFSYIWNNGNISTALTSLTAGTYEVTVTDQLGCTAVASKTVNRPTELNGQLTATNVQPGSSPQSGSATAVANGGTPPYFYQWNNGGTTATISGLMAGSYVVLITDTNGCTWTGETTVDTDPLDCSTFQSVFIANNTGCYGSNEGNISIDVSGGYPGYNFEWSNGATTQNIDELNAGMYTVTVTDDLGCSAIHANIPIEEQPELMVDLTANSQPCQSTGGSISAAASGGTGTYEYQWSNGATGSTITVNQSGGYQVTVTDQFGCVAGATTTIEISTSLVDLDVMTETASCVGDENGSAEAVVTGGAAPYNFAWSNGSTTDAINGLSAGNYSVTVTDAEGCSRHQIFSINEPQPIVLNCTGTAATDGSNGVAQVSGFGGQPPYSYTWDNGATGSFVQNLENGTYQVTVTDQNGCTETCSINLLLTSTNELETLSQLDIFPNPVSEVLNIRASFNTVETGTIRLFNIIGQQVWETPFSGAEIFNQIQVTDLSKGTYLMKLETGKGAAVKKVVVF